MSKWISVEERLPPRWVPIWMFNKSAGRWFGHRGQSQWNNMSGFSSPEPTHYQLIDKPEPPEDLVSEEGAT